MDLIRHLFEVFPKIEEEIQNFENTKMENSNDDSSADKSRFRRSSSLTSKHNPEIRKTTELSVSRKPSFMVSPRLRNSELLFSQSFIHPSPRKETLSPRHKRSNSRKISPKFEQKSPWNIEKPKKEIEMSSIYKRGIQLDEKILRNLSSKLTNLEI